MKGNAPPVPFASPFPHNLRNHDPGSKTLTAKRSFRQGAAMKHWIAWLRTWFRGRPRTLRRTADFPFGRLVLEALEARVTPTANFILDDTFAPLQSAVASGSNAYESVVGLGAAQSSFPYTGSGYSVAILDTGIDYRHPDLGGGFGAGHRVIAGYDFFNNDADPMDDNGHGTHLAGIIGGSGAQYPGVAPGVNLIALKVLGADASGSWTAIDNALQWVIANQSRYNIVGVNLSLGSGNYTSNPFSLFNADFAALKAQGVFTAIAAGNLFYSFNSAPGVGYPAVSSDVVSVGSVWAGDFGAVTFSSGAKDHTTAADRIVSMSQRGPNLSLLAPGAWITSTALGGGYRVLGGTSMATAIVTGTAVLVHEALDATGRSAQANQAGILSILQATGRTIVDGDDENDNVVNTGLAFQRIDIYAALASVGTVNQPPVLASVANQAIALGGSVAVTLSATDANNDPLTYSARVVDLAATAWTLDSQHGFNTTGNYTLNKAGANEKWIRDRNLAWFVILPSGELRRWAGSLGDTLKPVNLVTTFDATYWADPAKIVYAPYVAPLPVSLSFVGNRLTIQETKSYAGTFTIVASVSDGTSIASRSFTVTAGSSAPVLTSVPNQTMPRSQDKLTLTLSATTATGTITYSARVVPVNGVTPAVTLGLSGSQLTVNPAATFVGVFTVEVTASNGTATATKSFTVTVTNAAPTLGTTATQTMLSTQLTTTVALSRSDADGDAVTLSARVLTPSALAYQVDQQHKLGQSNGSYFTSRWGASEKWLLGAGNQWYILLPNGALYRWVSNLSTTMVATNLVAQFDASFYTEPKLLWDARPATAPAVTLTISGTTLTVRRTASVTGIYFVEVLASDGAATTKKTFQLVLN